MDIIKIIKSVFTEPTDFFKKVGAGKDRLGFAFGYFVLLSLVRSVLGIFVGLLILNIFAPLSQGFSFPSLFGTSTPLYIFFGFLSFVIGLGGIFVWAGILHLWILIFGGKKNYVKTFELAVYSGTPALLFGWIPLISFFASIWSLVLLIIGTRQIHGIERTKSILMYLIPLAVLLVVYGLLFVFVIMGFVGSMIASGAGALGGLA